MRPLIETAPRSTRFVREQSAALFVGVREFEHVDEIPYAVDDAVDLAHQFVFGRGSPHIPPDRVVLALSGEPAKTESRARLAALIHAGARTAQATPQSILTLLHKQASLVGRDGLLVVSIASHGFVRDGVPYILGASSFVNAPETTLSAVKLFDTISSMGVQRSVIFVDACRERVARTRGFLASALTAAPMLSRLGRTHGQVVLYAAAPGQYAYDDDLARNGVFTKAVIAGLNCDAAKVDRAVTPDTLARYVERAVRTWVRIHRDPNVGSATQSVIDGEAANMPLTQCWGGPTTGPSGVTTDGHTIHAKFDDGTPSWDRDAGNSVLHADVADVDADGKREVVFVTRNRIGVYDGAGTLVWSATGGAKLTAYAAGDLFRQHTTEIVAAWKNGTSSELAVYLPDGAQFGAYESEHPFEHVLIVRATSHHAPRIVATTGNKLLVFDPKKIGDGRPLWSGVVGPRRRTIRSLEVIDYDRDGRRDLVLTTTGGGRVVVDIKGHVIAAEDASFERVHERRRRTHV